MNGIKSLESGSYFVLQEHLIGDNTCFFSVLKLHFCIYDFLMGNGQDWASSGLLLTHTDRCFPSFSTGSLAGMTVLLYSALQIPYHYLFVFSQDA